MHSEWMMKRNAPCGDLQMDSTTGVKGGVVDFGSKLVTDVVIIKWSFVTSWYNL